MPAIRFARFADELESLYRPPLRAPATYRQVHQAMREFAALPGVTTSAHLSPGKVAVWIAAFPDRSPARWGSMLRTLAVAAKFGVKSGYLQHSPFDFRPPSRWLRADATAPDRPTVHRSAEEIARVLDLVDAEAAEGSWQAGRLQALVYCYAFTGLRKGEALHLERADIDLDRLVLIVRPKPDWRPKTIASSARLPIADPLAAVLARWLPRTGCPWVFPGTKLRGPWTGGCPGTKPLDRIRSAGERAGVPGLTILAFRKTAGTLAKQWGFSQLELKALLRHTSVQTQRYYDEDDVEVLRPAVSRIQFRCTSP